MLKKCQPLETKGKEIPEMFGVSSVKEIFGKEVMQLCLNILILESFLAHLDTLLADQFMAKWKLLVYQCPMSQRSKFNVFLLK